MVRKAERNCRNRGPQRLGVFLLILMFAAGVTGCKEPAGPETDSTAGRASGSAPQPSPTTGAIQIRTVTVGGGIDASYNQYAIKLGRDRVAAVGPNASALISGLSEGTYSVELVDLTACQVLGSNPRSMRVVPKIVSREIFRVHC